jgi:hypothetical protein
MTIQKPDQHLWFSNITVLDCPVPARMDHSGTGQVLFLDDYCIFQNSTFFVEQLQFKSFWGQALKRLYAAQCTNIEHSNMITCNVLSSFQIVN